MARRTYTSIVIDDLLAPLAFGGALFLTIAAPNSMVALEKPLMALLNGRDKRQEASRIARYMRQQKLVHVTQNDDGSYQISLTQKGETRGKKAYFERLPAPDKPWDQKWRIIMFDIPEKHKAIRDYLSKHMLNLGLKQLQRSVFIYPYELDEFVAIARDIFPEVRQQLIYLTVENIDIHNVLVKQFRHRL